MNRTVKLAAASLGIVCLMALALGYHYRGRIHRLYHRIRYGEAQGGAKGPGESSAPPVTNSVEINGKKFVDVLGYPPYYLAVTQMDSALFVTRLNNSGSNVFHVLNLKTGQDEQIPTIADFGRNIGATDGGFRDYVERVGPGEVFVASESSVGRRTKTVYRLDLAAGIVDTRVVLYYDQVGQLTNSTEGPGF
jgi:hypothetical protein